jgi:exopolyphosphatase/guanosine-5'-triphosphate,3'-diphosphate pyrophosphatase
MLRVAAIDIGTNSVKMTVADVDSATITELVSRSRITRLGRGVDANRAFSDEPLQTTLRALVEFATEAQLLGVSKISAVGTSAVRDASNGAFFLRESRQILPADGELISGDREAALAYTAAITDPALKGIDLSSALSFDVGGGSTEIVFGSGPRIIQARSLDIGAVRLTERYLSGAESDAQAQVALLDYVDAQLAAIEPNGKPSAVIGIGGTAAAVIRLRDGYSATLQSTSVSAFEIEAWARYLKLLPLDTRRRLPGIAPARADIVVAGLTIIDRLLRKLDTQGYVVSGRGVRYGLLMEAAGLRP